MGLIVIIILIIVIAFGVSYVRTEHMCGGTDQQCKCAGNETFTSTRPVFNPFVWQEHSADYPAELAASTEYVPKQKTLYTPDHVEFT